MWIESVAIRGFRSFRDRTEIKLDPHHTAIIGCNGSGKSSLLMAIFYVLQPKTRGRLKDLTLFHDGGDSGRFPSADIEIVINNEDKRFSMINSDKLKVMWTLGLKKDAIHINGKPYSYENWSNMLKTAGLMRDNFFAIHQGETSRLATALPSERLQMLESFAGATDHHKCHEKSVSLLTEARKSLASVDQQLEKLSSEIDSIEEQAEDLQNYKKLLKKKKLLTHILNIREKRRAEKDLRELRNKQLERQAKSEEISKRLSALTEERDKIENELNDAKRDMKSKEEEKKALQDDLEIRVSELQSSTDKIQSSFQENKAAEELKKRTETEVDDLKNQLVEKQGALEEADKKLSELEERHEDIERNIENRQRRIDHFYHRVGFQGPNFDPAEAKTVAKKSLKAMESRYKNSQATYNELTQKIDAAKREIAKLKSSKEKTSAEINELRTKRNEIMNGELHRFENESSSLLSEEKNLQIDILRGQARLEKANTSMREAMNKLRCKENLRHHFDSMTSLTEIFKYLNSNELDDRWIVAEYKGVVASHIGCHESLELAVSVALGKQLFFHIVSSANVANKILYWKERLELPGEFVFIPLDKIMPENWEFSPSIRFATDFLKHLNFPGEFEAAFKHLFNRKVIIKNAEYASELRDHKVDLYTLDGDFYARKGFLQGGYRRPKDSILSRFRDYASSKGNYETTRQEMDELYNRTQKIRSALFSTLEKKTKLDTQVAHTQSNLEKAIQDQSTMDFQIKQNESHLAKLEEDAKTTSRTLESLNANMTALENDLNSEAIQGSQEEREELAICIEERQVLKRNSARLFAKKQKAEQKRNAIRNEIDIVINPKLAELNNRLASPQSRVLLKANMMQMSEAKTLLKEAIKKLELAIEEVDASLAKLIRDLDDISGRYETMTNEVDVCEREHQDFSSQTDGQIQEEQLLMKRIYDYNQRILQDGISENLAQYENVKTQKCLAEMKKINKKLSKFSDVNMKAIDMQQSLIDKRKSLQDRRGKCLKAVDRGDVICEHLDNSKLQKVDFTFRQVAKYFAEIFSILVPDGRGRLQFARNNGSTQENNEENRPTAVFIHVSFNGSDEMSELRQLSGGQKSIVALAYSFALQKCDPSPIYIFDEIDANLDIESRKRVAEWLHNLKEDSGEVKPPQFITTSFRRELVEHSDKIIGVKMLNNASKTMDMSKTEALDFINQFEPLSA